jgi:hypothetical protein
MILFSMIKSSRSNKVRVCLSGYLLVTDFLNFWVHHVNNYTHRRGCFQWHPHAGVSFLAITKAVIAVIEHHFDNHKQCGNWCQAKKGMQEEVRDNRLHFLCKICNNILKTIMKNSWLTQNFDNCFTITTQTMCKASTNIWGSSFRRTKLTVKRLKIGQVDVRAVGLQSFGHQKLYCCVFALTGIDLDDDDITNLFRSKDSYKLWHQNHRRKEGVKITRMRNQYKKLRDGVAKLKVANAKVLG